MNKQTKQNNYGVKSLICLGISIICLILYSMTFITNEIIQGIFFYGGFIFVTLSFILSLIGIAKDKKKTLSIVSISILILFIVGIVYYINVILPKEIEETINTWQSSWGIKN